MKTLYKTLVLLTALSPLAASDSYGLDVTVGTPGTLATLVSEPSAVNTLSIKGEVNAADLFFIGKNMPSLNVLDLGDAVITAYSGDMLGGRATYSAGTIPQGAFGGLPLTSVTFPTTGKIIIDDAAFMGTDLKLVRLPENIDSVGVGAFASLPALTKVAYPALARVGRAVFSDCPQLASVEIGNATTIAPETFRRCVKLADVNGSAKLRTIGDGAFEGCQALRKFAFGPALKSIGERAFAATGLESLETLADCNSLTNIGEQAFANIPELGTVVLPTGITTVAAGTFFGDADVTTLSLPADIIELGNHALKGMSGLRGEVILPQNLETIGDYALMSMTGVDTLVLPSKLIRIGNYAMENMTSLSRIDASALTAVPETGTDVWKDVDQPDVSLTVLDLYETDFRNAPQWEDFNFDILSDADDTAADIVATTVRGRFTGTDFEIESTGAEIKNARLYNAAGVLLVTVEPHATTAKIDTSAFPAGVFIATVTLDNGTTATLKTAR